MSVRAGWTKPKAWSPEHEAYVRRFYAKLPLERIAKKLRRTATSVKARAGKLHLSKGRRAYRPEEDVLIRKLYPHRLTIHIAKMLGRSLSSVHHRANVVLGIKKSVSFMAALDKIEGERLQLAGGSHRFQKGIVPANKGLRRPGWAPGRMRETQFKKGQRTGAANNNWQPVGTVRFNADGYLVRKIADEPNAGVGALNRNWEFVHKRVWEDAHGPIPKGHRIWWKDGNHANCALENLELLSDKEHMARTTIHNPERFPPELKSAILMAGALKRKIREKTEAAIREAIA